MLRCTLIVMTMFVFGTKSYVKFRCRLMPLDVQSGRYVGTPVEEIICTFCDINAIETE